MGSTPRAHIAYGYDLGTLEDFRAAEAYDGYPNLPWYNNEGDEDFGSAIKRILLAAAGFTDVWTASDDTYFERKRTAEKRMGVELAYSGGEEPGYILAAKGSKQVTAWTGTMTLDPFVLERTPIDEGWDDKLAAALTALGITPTQAGPRWLVFPSYG